MKSQEDMNKLLVSQISEIKKSLNDRPLGLGILSSNTITNPRGDAKVITTRSGASYDEPAIPTTSSSSPPKVVEREPEVTTDKVQTPSSRSTAHVQPQVIPETRCKPEVVFEPPETPVDNPKSKTSIPYPSRLNEQKLREKASHQLDKLF